MWSDTASESLPSHQRQSHPDMPYMRGYAMCSVRCLLTPSTLHKYRSQQSLHQIRASRVCRLQKKRLHRTRTDTKTRMRRTVQTNSWQTTIPSPGLEQKTKGKKERLVCSQCKQVEVAREKELREKLKTSRRRKCTCQQAIGHKQTCPMHVSYAGERPYPGCDVISREDSEWFHQRTQKPRLS